jgi:hypothetical protein
VSTVAAVPGLGWRRGLGVAALCAAPPAAVWLTRRAVRSRRLRAAVPLPLREQRYHGSLEAMADGGRRSLRPVATTAYEVASRTGDLLAGLTAIPSVRIFHGLRPAGAGLPLIPHAISAGRQVVLIESVAWPPGDYETAPNGRIYCDGMYIGQSVLPFIAGVRYWQKILPKSHHVSAVIIVHPCADGEIVLPAMTGDGIAWVHARDAATDIRGRLLGGRQSVSWNMLAALIAATGPAGSDPAGNQDPRWAGAEPRRAV